MKLRTFNRVISAKNAERDKLARVVAYQQDELDTLHTDNARLRMEVQTEKNRAVKLGAEVDSLREFCDRSLEAAKTTERLFDQSQTLIPGASSLSENDLLLRDIYRTHSKKDADFREGHTQVGFKCIDCGLHFSLMTWNATKHTGLCRHHCPECGSTKCIIMGSRRVPWEIYEAMGWLSGGDKK